jgi:hypothetical protein
LNDGDRLTLAMASGTLPALVRVTGKSAEVVPTCTRPKFNALGEAVTSPAADPVPESGITI